MTPARYERHSEGVTPKFLHPAESRGHHVPQRTLPVGLSPWTSHSLVEQATHNGLNSPVEDVIKLCCHQWRSDWRSCIICHWQAILTCDMYYRPKWSSRVVSEWCCNGASLLELNWWLYLRLRLRSLHIYCTGIFPAWFDNIWNDSAYSYRQSEKIKKVFKLFTSSLP